MQAHPEQRPAQQRRVRGDRGLLSWLAAVLRERFGRRRRARATASEAPQQVEVSPAERPTPANTLSRPIGVAPLTAAPTRLLSSVAPNTGHRASPVTSAPSAVETGAIQVEVPARVGLPICVSLPWTATPAAPGSLPAPPKVDREAAELRLRVADQARDLGVLRAELAAAGDQLTALRAEVASAHGQLSAASTVLLTVRTELTATRAHLVTARADRSASASALADTAAALTGTRSTLAASQTQLAVACDELAATRARLAATLDELATTRTQLTAARAAASAPPVTPTEPRAWPHAGLWPGRPAGDPRSTELAEAIRRAGPPAAVTESSLLSVVVVTDTWPASIDRVVASVRAQRYATWELIVVDGRTGSVPPVLAPGDGRIRVVTGPSRARGACNRGLEIAAGRYAVVLDDRTCLGPDWLATVAGAAAARPGTAAFAGVVAQDLDPDQLAGWAAEGAVADRLAALVADGRVSLRSAGGDDFDVTGLAVAPGLGRDLPAVAGHAVPLAAVAATAMAARSGGPVLTLLPGPPDPAWSPVQVPAAG